MVNYQEVKISRILNPTSIDLGEYVINPYKGCEFGCLYCYVRSNRITSREARSWGSYVDIRINAPERLEKEIALRRPKYVLLGSTTECFQPIEKQCGISRQILEILNKYRVFYVILTRSPLIADYIPLFQEGFCKKIYFTINDMASLLKAKLEPKSPSYKMRFEAIEELLRKGISVIPYFSPVLPWISDFGDIFSEFSKAKTVEFEGLNFNLNNIVQVMEAVYSVYPEVKNNYEKMRSDKNFYEKAWEGIRKKIVQEAIKAKKSYNVYVHRFGGYFENRYMESSKMEDRK